MTGRHCGLSPEAFADLSQVPGQEAVFQVHVIVTAGGGPCASLCHSACPVPFSAHHGLSLLLWRGAGFDWLITISYLDARFSPPLVFFLQSQT